VPGRATTEAVAALLLAVAPHSRSPK